MRALTFYKNFASINIFEEINCNRNGTIKVSLCLDFSDAAGSQNTSKSEVSELWSRSPTLMLNIYTNFCLLHTSMSFMFFKISVLKHKSKFMKINIKLSDLLCFHRLLVPSRYLSEIILIVSSGKFYCGPEITLLIQRECLPLPFICSEPKQHKF